MSLREAIGVVKSQAEYFCTGNLPRIISTSYQTVPISYQTQINGRENYIQRGYTQGIVIGGTGGYMRTDTVVFIAVSGLGFDI